MVKTSEADLLDELPVQPRKSCPAAGVAFTVYFTPSSRSVVPRKPFDTVPVPVTLTVSGLMTTYERARIASTSRVPSAARLRMRMVFGPGTRPLAVPLHDFPPPAATQAPFVVAFST